MISNMFHQKKIPQETVVIIGAGIVSVTIAFNLSRLAKKLNIPLKITVIEQAQRHQIPNPLGSSHGKARILRLAIPEGEEYVVFAKRSKDIVEYLEKITGKRLFINSGGLIIGPKSPTGWPLVSAHYAHKNNIPFVMRNKNTLTQYPMLNLKNSELAYFEPSMGMLIPEECHHVLIDLAQKQGVEFHFGETYQKFAENTASNSITVTTDKANYQANKLILAMGAWLQKELTDLVKEDVSSQFSVHVCNLYSFRIKSEAKEYYRSDKCPVLIWQTDEREAFVFFPDTDSSGVVQFAIFPISDLQASRLSPFTVKNQPPLLSAQEVFKKYIEPHFEGISDHCEEIINYPFTMNKNEKFIYQSLPAHPNIKIVDLGSGHGYKHSFAIGEQIAQHVLTNKSELKVEILFDSFFQELQAKLNLNDVDSGLRAKL